MLTGLGVVLVVCSALCMTIAFVVCGLPLLVHANFGADFADVLARMPWWYALAFRTYAYLSIYAMAPVAIANFLISRHHHTLDPLNALNALKPRAADGFRQLEDDPARWSLVPTL